MLLLLASKYVVPSHINSGVFPNFAFSKLVTLMWGDEKTFNQKFGTLSIPGDFDY